VGRIYNTISEFLTTTWANFENELANSANFTHNIQNILNVMAKIETDIEKLSPEDGEDIFAKLAFRQLNAFVKLCYRDGYAPILSTLLYTAESQIYDILIEKNLGQKHGAVKELQESVLDILSIFGQDYPWTLYLHTLVTMQRLKRVMERLRIEGGQWGRWVKQIGGLVERGITNAATVLPFQISIKWLLEGLIPTKFNEKEMMEIGRLLRTLWGVLQGGVKFKITPYVPPSESEEIGRFFIDFVASILQVLQDKVTSTLKLPPIDKPIHVVVVWGDDARYTQSVAFFRDEGDRMGVYLFKPPHSTFYVPEEIHLLMHEGIPGHAYAVWLQEKMGAALGAQPIQSAFRLSQLGGVAFVDVMSIFHEGWAVFAQYLGSLLLNNKEITTFFYRELVSYLERFLVLQHIVPLYTVKPHIPRFAEPYQFASYFIGFLLWFMLYKKGGNIWNVLVRGEYPYTPTPTELIQTLNTLIEMAKKAREERDEVE